MRQTMREGSNESKVIAVKEKMSAGGNGGEEE